MSEAGGAGFDIGRVVNRIFTLIGRNLVPFVLLSLLAVLADSARNYFMSHQLLLKPEYALTLDYWLILLASEIVTIFLSFLLQAALTYASVRDLNGKPVSFAEALVVTLRAALPLFLICVLYTLGLAFAFVLLIFPSLMLWTAWSVIVPVRIVENTSIAQSFSRSARLTAGHRWPVFGILLVISLGTIALAYAARPFFGMTFGRAVAALPSYYIAIGVVHVLTYMVSATAAASIYYELRLAKDGIGPEHLAAVFE